MTYPRVFPVRSSQVSTQAIKQNRLWCRQVHDVVPDVLGGDEEVRDLLPCGRCVGGDVPAVGAAASRAATRP